ncbi:hypothetical protein ACROYT_G033301 [Oculina patagonica]
MADRKGRSVTFRTPHRLGLGELKAGIQKEIQQSIIVFQDLGEDVYLLELESKDDAELLVSNGFDIEEFYVDCSPPHGKFLNVSIMGLRSYVEDEDVKSALSEYGELKSEVIRLKYKADHELTGMENGNRLLGHMSYNCDQQEEENNEAPDRQMEGENDAQPAGADHDQQEAAGSGDTVTEDMRANNDLPENKDPESSKEEMDYEDRVKNLKRQHVTDSDSDGAATARRSKLKPAPNLSTRRKEKLSAKAEKPPSKYK